MTEPNQQAHEFLLSDAVLAKLQNNAATTARLRGPEVFNPVNCAIAMLSKSAGENLHHRLGWAFFYSWDHENPTSLPASIINAALLFCESLFDENSTASFTYPGARTEAPPPLATDWDIVAMPTTQQRAVCREIIAAIVGCSGAFYKAFGLSSGEDSLKAA